MFRLETKHAARKHVGRDIVKGRSPCCTASPLQPQQRQTVAPGEFAGPLHARPTVALRLSAITLDAPLHAQCANGRRFQDYRPRLRYRSRRLRVGCNERQTAQEALRVSARWSFAGRRVALPNPLKGFGHGLKLHTLVDVARGLRENELVRISFGLQHF